MTSGCSLFDVSCDRCYTDRYGDVCATFIPGVAGFCYRYTDQIASAISSTLPVLSGAYACGLLAKKIIPIKEAGESVCKWARRIKSTVGSKMRTAVEKIKETTPLETLKAGYSILKKNPGKALAVAAPLIIAPFIPETIIQMPILTALALGSVAAVKNGTQWIASLKDLVTRRENETDRQAKQRIFNNGMKALASGILLGGLGAGAGIVIPQMLSRSGTYSVWLPDQTEGVAMAEYTALSLLHLTIAIRDWANEKKTKSLFHFSASAATLAYAMYDLIQNSSLRLHHFWIGQLFQAFPLLGAKFLGLFLSTDGWVELTQNTGYNRYYGDPGYIWFASYGCDNTTIEHLSSLIKGGCLSVLLEGLGDLLLRENRPNDLSIWSALKKALSKPPCCKLGPSSERARGPLLDPPYVSISDARNRSNYGSYV